MIIETSSARVEIASSVGQLDSALPGGFFASHALDGRYYKLLEETLSGQFDFRYAILKHRTTGQMAVQPFFLTEVDVTAGLPPGLRAFAVRAVRCFQGVPRFKMLAAGCAAGEGALDCREAWAVRALGEGLFAIARREAAKLVVFKDFPARYRLDFEPLLKEGYRRIPSMPSTRLNLNFSSFEEYEALKMSANTRGNLRRKFRDSEKRARIALEIVGDASPWVDEIHALYLQTHSRSSYRFERLTPAYFQDLGRRLPDRVRYFLWRREGRLVAFASGVVHEGVLYYLNVGMDYAEALELHLYFHVWRDLVEWALAQRLTAIQAGQLSYAPKLRLGLDLVPLDLYVRPVSPLFGRLFKLILPLLSPVRYERALRKFHNYPELFASIDGR